MEKNSKKSASRDGLSASRLRRLRKSLLEWYDRESRSLPWRLEPSSYRTVVSEFMLQQTQVSTVLPFFETFISRFPSFEALSRASEEEVLAAWSGLGYYRRARALKRTAERIMADHDGELPCNAEALMALPGFGEYTAAAVGSIALHLPLAAIDGNVRRVVARLFATSEDAGISDQANRLLDLRRPGDWNQAMMELGAIVCSPRAPRCLLCPVHVDCRARRLGTVEEFPLKRKLPVLRRVEQVAVAAVRRGAVLLLQRGDDGPFAGMWELPSGDSRENPDGPPAPDKILLGLTRLRAKGFEFVGEAKAVFTHHRITTKLYLASGLGRGTPRRQRHIALRWASASELESLAASKAQRRLFELLRRHLGCEVGGANKKGGKRL